MSEALINHLWQSSLFALAAALLTLAFRANGARVRYLIWLAASTKFLIPFALLVWVGARLHWQTAPAIHSGLPDMMERIAQPGIVLMSNLASTPLARGASESGWILRALILAWLLGSLLLIGRRIYQWLYLRAIEAAALPLEIDAPIPVCETYSTLEPGVFGVFAPTLLLPAGITTQLPPAQLSAILEHELSHWRRRDNLTAAVQMLVEALFWFHPLVWWIGGRLIEERERACDEAVIQAGRDRQTYAEGILSVCRRYVEPPPCSAAVSGGRLRKRIEEIMTGPLLTRLSPAKRFVLAAVALLVIAGPLAIGVGMGSAVARAIEPGGTPMKRYANSEWRFELDVPKTWVAMPPNPGNSPGEVIRFMSRQQGNHNLIVFRSPMDPAQSPENVVTATQGVLTKAGFSSFVTGETTIGSRRVLTLEFSRPAPDGVATWYCREYFIVDGTLGYILGFGTTNRDGMFDLYERMAKSFTFE